jgi:transglutaminase-like putative cysteine protease
VAVWKTQQGTVNSGSGGNPPPQAVQQFIDTIQLQQGSTGISNQSLGVTYDLTHTITLKNQGNNFASKIKLWVAIIQHVWPYQIVVFFQTSPQTYRSVADEHGNLYALFEFVDVSPGEQVVVKLEYRVVVSSYESQLDTCQGTLPKTHIKPEVFIEAGDPTVKELAKELSAGKTTVCQQSKAFYNYVVENLNYTSYQANDRGARLTLETSGGDCTDFTDLFIALNRASGIPARFLEGITYQTNGYYSPGQTKHDWAEVYLPGAGWVPVDPTWGKRVSQRTNYFGKMSPDHIIVTVGRSPSQLQGYHYYYYEYWWNAAAGTTIAPDEHWYITRIEQ